MAHAVADAPVGRDIGRREEARSVPCRIADRRLGRDDRREDVDAGSHRARDLALADQGEVVADSHPIQHPPRHRGGRGRPHVHPGPADVDAAVERALPCLAGAARERGARKRRPVLHQSAGRAVVDPRLHRAGKAGGDAGELHSALREPRPADAPDRAVRQGIDPEPQRRGGGRNDVGAHLQRSDAGGVAAERRRRAESGVGRQRRVFRRDAPPPGRDLRLRIDAAGNRLEIRLRGRPVGVAEEVAHAVEKAEAARRRGRGRPRPGVHPAEDQRRTQDVAGEGCAGSDRDSSASDVDFRKEIRPGVP